MPGRGVGLTTHRAFSGTASAGPDGIVPQEGAPPTEAVRGARHDRPKAHGAICSTFIFRRKLSFHLHRIVVQAKDGPAWFAAEASVRGTMSAGRKSPPMGGPGPLGQPSLRTPSVDGLAADRTLGASAGRWIRGSPPPRPNQGVSPPRTQVHALIRSWARGLRFRARSWAAPLRRLWTLYHLSLTDVSTVNGQ